MNKKELNELFLDSNIRIFLLVLLSLISIIPIINTSKKYIQPKLKTKQTGFYHKEKGIIKEEEIDGIKFTNIKLFTKNNQTTFTAEVKNITGDDNPNKNLYIDLINKKGEVEITLVANMPGGMKKYESKTITATAKGEFKNVVTKKIRKLKTQKDSL